MTLSPKTTAGFSVTDILNPIEESYKRSAVMDSLNFASMGYRTQHTSPHSTQNGTNSAMNNASALSTPYMAAQMAAAGNFGAHSMMAAAAGTSAAAYCNPNAISDISHSFAGHAAAAGLAQYDHFGRHSTMGASNVSGWGYAPSADPRLSCKRLSPSKHEIFGFHLDNFDLLLQFRD